MSESGDFNPKLPRKRLFSFETNQSFNMTSLGEHVERLDTPDMIVTFQAAEIAGKSLRIAGKICIYTNDSVVLEEL